MLHILLNFISNLLKPIEIQMMEDLRLLARLANLFQFVRRIALANFYVNRTSRNGVLLLWKNPSGTIKEYCLDTYPELFGSIESALMESRHLAVSRPRALGEYGNAVTTADEWK